MIEEGLLGALESKLLGEETNEQVTNLFLEPAQPNLDLIQQYLVRINPIEPVTFYAC
jgi:hypothetical protein